MAEIDVCSLDIEVSSLDDDSLREHVLALGALADQVEAARLAALGEWDARTVWAIDGAASGDTCARRLDESAMPAWS